MSHTCNLQFDAMEGPEEAYLPLHMNHLKEVGNALQSGEHNKNEITIYIVCCEKYTLTFCPKALPTAYLFSSLSADDLDVYDVVEKNICTKVMKTIKKIWAFCIPDFQKKSFCFVS